MGLGLQIEKSRWRAFRREQILDVQKNEVTNIYAIHVLLPLMGFVVRLYKMMWLPVDVSDWSFFG